MEPVTRQQYTGALRALADFLDANPHLPIGENIVASWVSPEYDGEGYDDSNIVTTAVDAARKLRNGTHGWKKDPGSGLGYVTYRQSFTPGETYPRVSYVLMASKTGTCERVEIGTRHIEAVEAHDEPIYQWICDPSSDAS